MEVPQGQDGIQQLLAAEQEAQAIVAQARKAKAERLRQAKDEAELEVAAFKAEREAEYQRKLHDASSGTQENLKALAAESDRAVAAIKESIAAKEGAVLKMLLDEVQTVRNLE